MAAAAGGKEGRAHGGTRRTGGSAANGGRRATGGKERPRRGGKRLRGMAAYVLFIADQALLRDAEKTPPFPCRLIFRHIGPFGRVLDMQHGIGFRPLRTEDYFGRGYGLQILRQNRDERGLGIGDERKRSILRGIFGIRAGRACGRAAARHGDRRGEISRTALRTARGGRQGRLRRSTSRPPEPATGSGGS